MRNQKGITLIALVITIIVLLILAGVAIAMLSGDNGILNQASRSSYQTTLATVKEEISTKAMENVSAYYEYNNADSTTATAQVASSWTSSVDAIDAAVKSVLGNAATDDTEPTGTTSQKNNIVYTYTAPVAPTTGESATPGTAGTIVIKFKSDKTKKVTGTVDQTTGQITWNDADAK